MWGIFHRQLFKLANKDLPESSGDLPTMVFQHSSIANLRILVSFEKGIILLQVMRESWEWGDVVRLSEDTFMISARYIEKAVSLSRGENFIFFQIMEMLEMPKYIIRLLQQAEGVKAFANEFVYQDE